MYLKSTYVWICAMLVMVSCSQESTLNPDSDNTTASLVLSRDQQPLAEFDHSKYGIYHGTVLSATTMNRGKIWINLANNGEYNAMIELVSGAEFYFELDTTNEDPSDLVNVFDFVGDAGTFSIDISNLSNPSLQGLEINNESFFAQVVKSMSFNMASSQTATFAANGYPEFTGSWSMIANGSLPNPNGNNGDGITSVMIVYDGSAYEEFVFNDFNSSSCLGNSNYIPTLNSFATTGYTICDYQDTAFAGGMSKWNLSYDPTLSTYMDYITCNVETSGTFNWTSNDGTEVRIGQISLD